MSTATLTPMTDAAIRAQVELYRQMALRWNRTRTTQLEGTDPIIDLFSTRPLTEDEAEAEAAEMAANFERILRERNRQGFEDAYLLLGNDLIFEMPQGK